MVNSKQRERYRTIRYDYYHAGRLLHLAGNFHCAGIMLGYTVETTMKAGLMEVITEDQQKGNETLNKSHDVRKIFVECGKHGLFADVQVSADFLDHINYHFQRYPSQQSKVLGEASKQNKVIGNSIDWINYYDDLVVQLDHHLLKTTSDPSISILYHAIRTLETRNARDILRENVFAHLKFEEYARLIRQNMPEREDHRKTIEDNLSKGATFYWNPDSPEVPPHETMVAIAKKYSASTFELPKWRISNGYMETVIP
jgi:hypothetical protein